VATMTAQECLTTMTDLKIRYTWTSLSAFPLGTFLTLFKLLKIQPASGTKGWRVRLSAPARISLPAFVMVIGFVPVVLGQTSGQWSWEKISDSLPNLLAQGYTLTSVTEIVIPSELLITGNVTPSPPNGLAQITGTLKTDEYGRTWSTYYLQHGSILVRCVEGQLGTQCWRLAG
jgi:hypothetical protein